MNYVVNLNNTKKEKLKNKPDRFLKPSLLGFSISAKFTR